MAQAQPGDRSQGATAEEYWPDMVGLDYRDTVNTGLCQYSRFLTGGYGLSDVRSGSEQRLLAMKPEFLTLAGNDEGSEKDRHHALSGASEGDDFALGSVEGLGSGSTEHALCTCPAHFLKVAG